MAGAAALSAAMLLLALLVRAAHDESCEDGGMDRTWTEERSAMACQEERAMKLLSSRRPDMAELQRSSLAASAMDPDNGWTCLVDALVAVARKQHARASAEYAKCIERGGRWRTSFLYANHLVVHGDLSRAMELYGDALTSRPCNAATFLNAGNTLMMMNRTADAARSYRAALRLHPSLTDAKCNLMMATGPRRQRGEHGGAGGAAGAAGAAGERLSACYAHEASKSVEQETVKMYSSDQVDRRSTPMRPRARTETIAPSSLPRIWQEVVKSQSGGNVSQGACACDWTAGGRDSVEARAQELYRRYRFKETVDYIRCCLSRLDGEMEERRGGREAAKRSFQFDPCKVGWAERLPSPEVPASDLSKSLSLSLLCVLVSSLHQLCSLDFSWQEEEKRQGGLSSHHVLLGGFSALLTMNLDRFLSSPSGLDQGTHADIKQCICVTPLLSLFYPLSEPAIADLARFHFSTVKQRAWRTLQQGQPSPLLLHHVTQPLSGTTLIVGFLSQDFTGNSVGRELLAIVSHLDRRRVLPLCISLTDLSSIRTSMARSSWEAMRALCSQQGEFIDLDGLELSSASSLLNRKSLHVLVDVQGWNDGGSIALLASRPAPLQISFKNFVGTLGDHDVVPWIISDRIASPPDLSGLFTESLILLPGTYYGAGHHKLAPFTHSDVSELNHEELLHRSPARLSVLHQHGVVLPSSGFIFGAFSNLGKVHVRLWQSWCRILQAVNQSHLWIIAEPPFGVDNLIEAARGFGVEERIVATSRIRVVDHASVKHAAGVYLDSRPFNGHSTVVEALWGGIPVLTLPVERMAGRVAASVLHAVGLGRHLTVRDGGDYEALAIKLASGGGRRWLERSRRRLAASRGRSILFDINKWSLGFETSLRLAWEVVAQQQQQQQQHAQRPHIICT